MTVSNFHLVTRLVAFVALFSLGSAAFAGGADTDSDGVPDATDNCTLIANPLQRDTDNDSFGNFCDADLSQDLFVNVLDLYFFRLAFFSGPGDANWNPNADLNGDDFVNFGDLLYFRLGFFQPPGPSANAVPSDIALDNASVDENEPATTAVGTFTTADLNVGETYTYTLVPGPGDTDNGDFAIVGDQLETAAVLNFEATDNCMTSAATCSIRVQTDDGNGGQFEKSFVISIGDVNDAPVITSDGGLSTASLNVDENQTAVTTVIATDEDLPPQTLTFSISGGADAAQFGLAGGVLTFNSAPDADNPLDVGGDNDYEVEVTVTDDGASNLSDMQAITVTVDNLNEAPVITSDGGGATASLNADENQVAVTTVTATDSDVPAQILTFSISGGADAALFGLAGGVLTFNSAPDADIPLDVGGDNNYEVEVTVTDDGAPMLADTQAITVTVDNLNEAPVITSDGGGATASLNADENQTAVTTVTAADPDVPAQTLTFTISGGADAALFGIAGGVLTFNSAPDFENPLSRGVTDNIYEVEVTVTDDGAPMLTDVQAITVTVDDVNDAPEITSNGGGATASVNAAENQSAVTTVTAIDQDLPAQNLTFSISGGADASLFGLVGGVLTFNSDPDFETALDVGGDNNYEVEVTVTDDGAPAETDVQAITVTVTDVAENEAPVITSDGGGAAASVNAPENQTAVTTVTATDADVPAQNLTFSISGGADMGKFNIDMNSGVLTFASAPNFENELDANGDNDYEVEVTVTDDGTPILTDVQAITVTVTNVNDDPTDIALSNASVDENEPAATAVGTFTTTDEDAGDSHTYSLVAGGGDTDNAEFMIVGNELQTAAVLDFETTASCTTSASTCSVRVQTDDGNGGMYSEAFIIDINNVNDAPVAAQDDYTGAIGNVRFALVTALSGTTPVPPTVELVGDIDTNDTDQDSADTLTVTANASIPTDQGGSVAVDANGQFVYSPPAGFPGSGISDDEFTYEICDNGTVPGPLCDNGTVTIAGTDIVWFVDDSSANNPGTGTSDDPFRDLSSAGGPSLAGEQIFVHSGTQTTGITLKNNQALLGEGLALVVGTTTLVDAGTRPVISNAGGTAVTLGSSNTVRGLDITGSQQGIVGNAFGTLTADNIAISTTGGAGIDLTNGACLVTFDSLSSSTSATSGIDLDSVSGSCTLGGGAISGSTGPGIDITSSTATVSYGGAVAAGSDLAVNISGQSANSVSLSGNITSSGQGILLNANTGGTINLSGGMSLSTGAFTAFSATNGGTVNVTGTNTVTTGTATAVAIVDTTIGGSGVTFQSINSSGAGANGILLDDTGSGTFTIAGTGASGTGGTISNKTDTAVTFNNTDGRITFNDLIIEDIGALGGTFNTRSGHDGIHGQDVNGGLTLDNVIIRRISDNCVNGSLFSDGITESFWDGLDILNSTIEQCNRFHVANVADTQDEGGVRIAGLTGSVTIDNNTFDQTGEHLDIFTHSSGTLTMAVTNNFFIDAYQEYNPPGPVVSVGGFCIDVTVEGSSDANVTIGGTGGSNDFENCGTGSIRVAKDTVPAGNSNIDFIVDNNTFRVTDQTSANGAFGNTPQGGVLLRAGPGPVTTFDGLVQNNTFGIAIGPDDRIGSTGEEVTNADGVGGNVVLIFDSGVSQARVNNNVFNGSINAPWVNRADGNTSAAVLYKDNSYRGRDDYCCDGGFVFTVPGIPYRTQSRNGGDLDITFINDQFEHHDQFFFAGTETLEFLTRNDSGFPGGTMCMAFHNVSSPDGYEFKETSGTLEMYQGATNNAATGPCAPPHGTPCEAELADDGVRGGPNTHAATGTPTPGLNPPHVDVDGSNSITIVPTACTLPSGGIFN